MRCPLAGEVVFAVREGIRLQGLGRIAADVADTTGEVIGIADHAVEVVLLPEGTLCAKELVELFGGVAFPARNHFPKLAAFFQRSST